MSLFRAFLLLCVINILGPVPAATRELSLSAIGSATLLDHEGRSVDLAQELQAAKTPAVLSFSYLGCKTICPAIELEMQRLDAALRPEIRIFTLTLNPLEDTVERLAARAKERGASGRWRFLTGDAAEVYRLLDRFGVRVGSLDEHPSVAFLAWRSKIYQMNGPLSADDAIAAMERMR